VGQWYDVTLGKVSRDFFVIVDSVLDVCMKKGLNICQMFKLDPHSFNCCNSIKFHLILSDQASIESRFGFPTP